VAGPNPEPKRTSTRDDIGTIEEVAHGTLANSTAPSPADLTKPPVPSPADLAKRSIRQPAFTQPHERPAPKPAATATPKNQLTDSDFGNYYTTISFAPKDATPLRQTINKWLSEKNIPIEFGTTQIHRSDERKQFVETITTTQITSRFDELKIVENTVGYFSTTIRLATSTASCILEVEVVSPEGAFAQPPRFIRKAAARGSVDGAPLGWHANPVHVDGVGLPDLIDYISNPERTMPVFVVGTTEDTPLREAVDSMTRTWGKFLAGNATLAILSSEATILAEDRLGHSLSPSPWSIRTYVPGFDASAPFEGRRHRLLGRTRALEDDPIKTAALLGRISSKERAIAPPSELLSQTHRSLNEARNRILVKGEFYRDRIREETRRLRTAEQIGLAPAPNDLSLDETKSVTLLKQLIEVPTLTEEFVFKLAEAYEAHEDSQLVDRLNELTGNLEKATRERDLHAEDNRILLGWIEESEDRNDQLVEQARILAVTAAQAQAINAHSQSDLQASPISDLLDEIETFEDLSDSFDLFVEFGIVLTCDTKVVSQLDDIDTNGRAIKQTVRALRTLADYVRAKRDETFTGNMHAYLAEAPAGYHVVSSKMHASRESESTMARFGHLRQFPLPESGFDDTFVSMQAHFKIDKIGIKSPRMHYFDATSSHGVVIVGYIGPHLQTEGTN
jgi:hypothetical protein